jgi:hypothetical protein
VLELAKQFEGYCIGPVDPGRQMPGDPPPDSPAKPSKKDMAKYLR